jgi:hypothetical protein
MITIIDSLLKNGINTSGEYIMPKKNDYIKYSDDELNLLSNTNMTAKELASIIKVGVATIHRSRKRLGINVPLGAKKGKLNPKNERKEVRICKNENCSNKFTIKRSNTKQYCSHSCHSRTLKFPNRVRKSKDSTPEYKKYSGKVHRLSQKIYEENIDIINPNRYQRTLCGVKDGWQLDHIMPISECFEKGKTPEEASSLKNLRMLPWKTNLMRNYDNS